MTYIFKYFLSSTRSKKKKENYVNVVRQQTLTFVILILWMQFFTEILRHRLHLCLSLCWNTREGRIRREQMAGVGRCMCLYVQRYVCSVQCDFWALANFLHKYLCILMAKFTLFFWCFLHESGFDDCNHVREHTTEEQIQAAMLSCLPRGLQRA